MSSTTRRGFLRTAAAAGGCLVVPGWGNAGPAEQTAESPSGQVPSDGPAPLDDCYDALTWTANNAETLAIDPERIAVGGLSAGGALAAGLALRARDDGRPQPCFQLLVIPCIDDRHQTPSSRDVTDNRLWNRKLSLKAWEAYLGKYAGEPPIYAAPGRAKDLKGLPPAFVSVEDNDLLRDEGIGYGQRLMQADVTTELHVYPGTFHGSLMFEEPDVSRRHRRDMLAALKRALWS